MAETLPLAVDGRCIDSPRVQAQRFSSVMDAQINRLPICVTVKSSDLGKAVFQIRHLTSGVKAISVGKSIRAGNLDA